MANFCERSVRSLRRALAQREIMQELNVRQQLEVDNDVNAQTGYGRGTVDVVALHVPAVCHGADDVQGAVHVAFLSMRNDSVSFCGADCIRYENKKTQNVRARAGRTKQ